MPPTSPPSARERLLDAAFVEIRTKGYAATSVDDLCRAAGVTKGAFFHHFRTKDELAVAAAAQWSAVTSALFEAAPYHAHPDPLDRILGYVDFRAALMDRPLPDLTCLVGTMVQETYETHPDIRSACAASIWGHAASLEADIAAAMSLYGAPEGVTAASLALHTQAVLQGGFILAKAQGEAQAARDSAAHLKRYIALLFRREIAT
jgi:TetR/AcrR family transcriptional repressor of nem operon